MSVAGSSVSHVHNCVIDTTHTVFSGNPFWWFLWLISQLHNIVCKRREPRNIYKKVVNFWHLEMAIPIRLQNEITQAN